MQVGPIEVESTAVKIDPEFSALIPPPSAEERAELEASLLASGCRDALVTWSGQNILLDGHTRLPICQQHEIQYRIAEVECADRGAAIEWIVRNQLGRRHLTPFQRAELVAHLGPVITARARENQRGCLKSDNPIDTKREMARLAGMSHGTWLHAKQLIEQASDDLKEQLRRGEISIHGAAQRLARPKRRLRPKRNAGSGGDDHLRFPARLKPRLDMVARAVGRDTPSEGIEALLQFVEGDGNMPWAAWAVQQNGETQCEAPAA